MLLLLLFLQLQLIVRTSNNPVIYSGSKLSRHHIVNKLPPNTKEAAVEVAKTVETSSKTTKVRNNQIRTEWELASATIIDLGFA